jgi:hypothetical protein
MVEPINKPRGENTVDFCKERDYTIKPTTIHTIDAVTDRMILEHLTDTVVVDNSCERV